ncbi:MAG TPA: methyltransferase [Thermoanaerobaculia bacterium]
MTTTITETSAQGRREGEEPQDVDRILMQLLAGAWVTQAIATAARLGIPDALASGPKTIDEIAAKAGANRGATKRLMRMLTGIGVFATQDGGRYALTPVSERLRDETPGSLKHMFIAETDGVHWRSWEKSADAVRTGLPRPKPVFGMPAFDYYSEHQDEGEQFGRAMANVSGFASQAVLDAYDFGALTTIMDVGGGNGSMVRTILEKHPQVRGIVADLPYIADQATAAIRESAMAERCRFEPTDFFRSVPKGADGHLLKFILHDWNDDECATILRNCRAAIAPGGRLMVLEVVVPDTPGPDFSHVMDLNMLVMTGGMERTAAEYEALFARGGFRLKRIVSSHSPFSVIEGEPA